MLQEIPDSSSQEYKDEPDRENLRLEVQKEYYSVGDNEKHSSYEKSKVMTFSPQPELKEQLDYHIEENKSFEEELDGQDIVGNE